MDYPHNTFYKNAYSLEERKILKELLDKGLTWEQIGKSLNRRKYSVRNEVNRNGGRYKYDPIKTQEKFEKNLEKVGIGRKVRYLTLDERKIIEKGIKQHLTITEIGRLLGRPAGTIKTELAKHGPREIYNAEEAHLKHSQNIESRVTYNLIPITEEQLEVLKQGFASGYSHSRIMANAGIGRERFNRWYVNNRQLAEQWKTNATTIIDRINALEAQIEIILDLIKEKNDQENNRLQHV